MTLEKVDCPFCQSKSATVDLPEVLAPGGYVVPFRCAECGNEIDITVHLGNDGKINGEVNNEN